MKWGGQGKACGIDMSGSHQKVDVIPKLLQGLIYNETLPMCVQWGNQKAGPATCNLIIV